MNGYIKRRGFTLVELLIVIVVIGILSAMMMLSSTEAVSSARAADIISDLRNLKTAALAWYMDNLDEIEAIDHQDVFRDSKHDENAKKIMRYMSNNNPDKLNFDSSVTRTDYKYSFGSTDDGTNIWYVWCKVDKDMNVRKKLEARAALVGLVGSPNFNGSNITKGNVKEPFMASDTKDCQYVGLRIK